MNASRTSMSCDEVTELAGLYVLDALEPAERAAVAKHLAACPNAHEEMAELGSVLPALATAAPAAGAPAALKRRVMDAYRADTAAAVSPGAPAPVSRPWLESRRPGRYGWAAAATALLIVAVIGAWGVTQAAQADRAQQRTAQLEQAIAALTEPGSSVAILHGEGPASGANGFAAFPPDGTGYVVLSGLPTAPAGQTYQAWYIVDGQPSSAGLVTVGSDGYAILAGMDAPAETEVVALTLEPAGGSEQPTTQPIVVGQVATPA